MTTRLSFLNPGEGRMLQTAQTEGELRTTNYEKKIDTQRSNAE